MLYELITNPVVAAVLLLLVLSILRINVVFALLIASLTGGLLAGKNCIDTINVFNAGLSRGATIAFNYAMLGAFSITISRSGITELLAKKIFQKTESCEYANRLYLLKYTLLLILTIAAIFSQNLIPVHIAFIPILIPPLLPVFNKLKIDRRAVACILSFGLITPYMFLPFGFGKIFLHDILIGNIKNNGLDISPSLVSSAMAIPALGMFVGLLLAVFISYRRPRDYKESTVKSHSTEQTEIKPWKIIVAVIAIAIGLAGQLIFDSLIIAALGGIAVFVISKVISLRDTQDVFTRGVYLMGGIGIVMIAASGFAEVMKNTGCISDLINCVSKGIGNQRGLAIFLMLLIGLIITMGIGSSFSTIPLIAAIYVPLCEKLDISALATLAIIGVAGALGDAGSPVSESVLGPTAGLNADGQHDHIYDSTIPTFIHYNIPLLAAGWIAGMIL